MPPKAPKQDEVPWITVRVTKEYRFPVAEFLQDCPESVLEYAEMDSPTSQDVEVLTEGGCC